MSSAAKYNPACCPAELECGRLREQFAKCCFETLLQFSLFSPALLMPASDDGGDGVESSTSAPLLGVSGEGVTSKLAVTSLLHRFKDVLCRFVDDTAISGGCPLPRHRLAEVNFVLQAIATLLSSLQGAPPHKGEVLLVGIECTCSVCSCQGIWSQFSVRLRSIKRLFLERVGNLVS
ncbi:Mon2 C-terminal [Trinorchestia longiramus]|nr:Mon2 C-terminal [Trinorchestia longiramus]